MNRSWTRTLVIGALSAITVVSSLSATASVTALAYQGGVLPNTYLAAQAIGGQPIEETQPLVERAVAGLANSELALTLEDQHLLVTPAELGIALDAKKTAANLERQPDQFDWVKPRYWQNFFRRKQVQISYQLDQALLQQKIREKFGSNRLPTPTDSQIVSANGQLTVSPATDGLAIDLTDFMSSLENLLGSAQAGNIRLQTTPTKPTVETAAAEATVTEIKAALQPVTLTFEDRVFTIAVADQYELLAFTPQNGRISWRIADEKLRGFLDREIARPINTKMIERVVMADSNQVTNEGRDGRQVQIDQLAVAVRQATTTVGQSPIAVPVQTIATKEKRIYPDFEPGRFAGVYLDISLAKQTIYVVNGNERTASYIISTGRRQNPTPTGTFYLKNKIPLAQSRLYPGLWMKRWNALAKTPDGGGYQGYGIHDLPCFDPNCNQVEGLSHLGRPVSHGCIRVEATGAGYIYDNLPVGTPVYIH